MGTHSYSIPCPKCSEQMNCWNDTRTNEVGGECLNCGYTYWTNHDFKSLKELNEIREEFDLKPLSKKEYNKIQKEIIK